MKKKNPIFPIDYSQPGDDKENIVKKQRRKIDHRRLKHNVNDQN
jgi:hypothetical protein